MAPAGRRRISPILVVIGLAAIVFLLIIGFTSQHEAPYDPPAAGNGFASPSATSESPSPTATPTPTPAPTPTASAPPAQHAQAQLALLALAKLPKATVAYSGYVRTAFGDGWKDTDHNGCDSRNDTLGRDLRDPAYRPGTHDCIVTSGILHDPYTKLVIDFVRGPDSAKVQIDHMVPLSWAWKYGAAKWTAVRRIAFANDPHELLAVEGAANESKSDSGPSQWLPPARDYWCTYAIKFTNVLSAYTLAVPTDDRATLVGILRRC